MSYGAQEWGVSPRDAQQYLDFIGEHRYYATALMCPVLLPDSAGQTTPGMVIATSTAATTAIQKENMRMHQLNQGIQNPYWAHLEVWVYRGLAFLNYAGIGNPEYNGTKLEISFGEFLRQYCVQQNVEFSIPRVFGGAILAPLRDMLRRLNIQVWAEMTFGMSYHAYRGLDGYVRIFGAGITSPDEEAHYLLNTQDPPSRRRLMRPEQWYYCRSWYSFGQKPCIAEWNLELLAAMTAADPRQYRLAMHRARVLEGHLRARL